MKIYVSPRHLPVQCVAVLDSTAQNGCHVRGRWIHLLPHVTSVAVAVRGGDMHERLNAIAHPYGKLL